MGHRVLESFVGLRERVGRVVAPTHTRRQTMHCFYYYKQEPLAHFNISEGAETRRRRSRRRRPLWFLELLSSVTSLAVSLASSPSLSLSTRRTPTRVCRASKFLSGCRPTLQSIPFIWLYEEGRTCGGCGSILKWSKPLLTRSLCSLLEL